MGKITVSNREEMVEALILARDIHQEAIDINLAGTAFSATIFDGSAAPWNKRAKLLTRTANRVKRSAKKLWA